MNVKNIIFDLGGVIINLDYNRTADAFKKLGVSEFDVIYSQKKQELLFDEFEKGNISDEQFRSMIKQYIRQPVQDSDIDAAWNAMLLDIPVARMSMLKELSKKYKIFLLSNTNTIHVKAFTEIVERNFGKGAFENTFEKVYYSCFLKMRKPDREIFDKVISENKLDNATTIFIDDSEQHVAGARQAGLTAFHLEKNQTVEGLLESILHKVN